MQKTILISALMVSSFTALGTSLHAQDIANTGVDIVVTASRRAQTITDIPIAVTAVSGDALSANDIRDIADLSASIPNFKAGNGGYVGEAISIRGLGTGQDRAFEQAVGLYVDGVYFPRSRAYRSAFFDLDRVEVMRGPQAVLQGLNSTAGAVSVISKKAAPGVPFSLDLAGNSEFRFSGFGLEGATSFSPADWLGVRAAVRYGEDGAYYFNSTTQKEENKRKDFAARVTVSAALNDTTNLTVKLDHSYYHSNGAEGEAVGAPAPLAGAFAALIDDGHADWVRTQDASLHKVGYSSGFFRENAPMSRGKNDGVMADLSTEIAGGTLSLIGSYYRSKWDQELDVDGTDATFLEGGNYEKYNQTSASVQYVSQSGKPIEYVVGAYYQHGILDFVLPNAVDPSALGIPFGIAYTGLFHQRSDLYSVFGSATYNITPDFRFVGGLRYVNEKKAVNVASDCTWRSLADFSIVPDSAVGFPVNDSGLCSSPTVQVPGGINRSRRSEPVMFETAVQYDLRPDVMTYVKYSTSSKSGGFSASDVAAADNLEFGDERARGFEAGLKARLLSNRMTLALTAFRTSFSDLQLKSDIVTDLGQSITIVSNAGRSRSQGFEIDMRYSPDNRLLFQLAAGYLDGKFTDFTTAPCGTSNVAPTGATACDFSGRVMPFAAHWTGSASFQWVPQITERAKAIIAPSVEFSSKYYTDGTLDQAGLQNNWAKIDARLGLAGLDGRWELSLIGKNLTNRRVLSGFQPAILYPIAFYGVPRTMSLRLAYHM